MDQAAAPPPRTASVARGSFESASPCPYGRCDGTGFVLDPETDLAHPCECREARVAAARSSSLDRRIPRRFRDVAFERWPVTEMDRGVVDHVRDFCETVDERLDRGESLALYGPKRSGKTTLAMLISKHALASNRTVAIYTLPKLLTEIRETYNDRSERTYGELMRQVAMVDLLHVDDMAVMEQPNPWVLEQLYTIVNTRYEDERSMLITADVDELRELEAPIGARTAWRLIEMSHPVAVPDAAGAAPDAVQRAPGAG